MVLFFLSINKFIIEAKLSIIMSGIFVSLDKTYNKYDQDKESLYNVALILEDSTCIL